MTMPHTDPGLPPQQQQQQQMPPAPYAPQPIVVHVPAAPAPQAGDEVFTRDQLDEIIGKVRKEEKEKLYPELQRVGELEHTVQELREAREAELAQIEAARQAEAERLRLEEEAKQTELERLASRQAELEAQLEAQRLETERNAALLRREAEHASLVQYRAELIQQHTDEIAPQLLDFIEGNSREELEQRVALAIQRSAEIVQELQSRQLQQTRQVAPPPSGAPPVDLLGQTPQERVFTPEDIANMSPSEYAANRPLLLQAASERVRSQGYADR